MCLILAVGVRPEPAAQLWTDRLSHPGLRCSPLQKGRNEGPTSRSCHVPGAPGRRAKEGMEVLVGVGGCSRCGAHRSRLRMPPQARPVPRGRPGTAAAAQGKGVFPRSSQCGLTWAWLARAHGLRPVQWRGRGRGRSAASCGTQCFPGACLSHRCAREGRGLRPQRRRRRF